MEIENSNIIALTYVRVSSERQVKEGHGLDSQSHRCIQYSDNKGYEIGPIFREEGQSGGLFERPAMKKLLQYIEANPDKKFVVVFDDLKRFARDVDIHFKIKREIYGRGATVECPNFNFEDTPTGKFVETIIAASAELERNENKRQVKQKMKARLEKGFWPFCPPPGLKNKHNPLHGKVLTLVQPFANIYKEAFEKYANHSLNTLHEVRLFIGSQYIANGIERTPSITGTRNILTELLYAGFLEYPKWGIPRMKAQHEGFIDIELFERVQDKLLGKATPSLRKDYNLDFPLRGLVLCNTCMKPVTASWNKGRLKRYANYACKTAGCVDRYKTIPRDKLHAAFESLLSGVKPSKNMLKLTKAIITLTWEKEKQSVESEGKVSSSREKELSGLITIAIENSIKSRGDPVLKKLYEQKAKDYSLELEELRKNIKPKKLFTKEQLGTACDKVFKILEDPVTTWRNGNLETKKTILYMHFNNKIPYSRETGFGTTDLALPISLMKQNIISQNSLVEMSGIEPESNKVCL